MRFCIVISGPAVRFLFLLTAVVLMGHVFGESHVLAQEEMHEPELFSPQRESWLSFLYNGLGLRYLCWFILLYLVQFIAWIIAIVVVIRDGSQPKEVVTGAIANGDLKGAWSAVQGDRSYVSQLLKQVFAVPGIGGSQASRLFARQHERRRTISRIAINALLVVAAVALFTGIYGTIDSILASLMVISSSDTMPRPSSIFAGIAYALVTSYLGLAIACSATLWFGLFAAIHNWRMACAAAVGEELICRFMPEKSGK